MTNLSNDLEAAIDRNGLKDVLETLAEIAAEKAQYVRETWQDKALAREWDHASSLVLYAASHVKLP